MSSKRCVCGKPGQLLLARSGGNRIFFLNCPKQVLEYCDHHQTEPLPTGDEPSADESRKRTTDIGEWDQKFISVDQEMLFEIILAANYLDIKPLL
jgi:hypothetical protein